MFLCIALFKYSHLHEEKVPDHSIKAKKVKEGQRKQQNLKTLSMTLKKYVAKE